MGVHTRHLWIGDSIAVRYFAGAALAITAIFVSLKPQASGELGVLASCLFWLLQTSLALALLVGTQLLLARLFPGSRHPWLLTFASGLLGALFFSLPAYVLDELLHLNEPGQSVLHGLLDELQGVLLPVVATWLALNAPWILKLDFSSTALASPAVPETAAVAAEVETASAPEEVPLSLLHQLKIKPEEVIALSSELHYVRIYYRSRSHLVLYSLRDAIAEMPADMGVQIHRSHWVAKQHLVELQEDAGVLYCCMANGQRFPVSRRRKISTRNALLKGRP